MVNWCCERGEFGGGGDGDRDVNVTDNLVKTGLKVELVCGLRDDDVGRPALLTTNTLVE